MNTLKFMLLSILLTVLALPSDLYGQSPAATANFQKSDVEITTTPEYPGICDKNKGIEITINEDFDSYEWHAPDSKTILSGKTVTLKQTGIWKIAVTYTFDGQVCSKERELNVKDLNNPIEIKSFFENAGFIAYDIFRDRTPASPSNDCVLSKVSFLPNESKILLKPNIESVLNNFKPLFKQGGNVQMTENNCLCSKTMEEWESSFNGSTVGVWAHEFFEKEDDLKGILFTKAKMENEPSLPLDNQKSFLQSNTMNILQANSGTEEHTRVLISNLFMPYPIGGYDFENLCNNVSQNDAHYLTPANIPVYLPNGASNVHFSSDDTDNDVPEGAIIKFNQGESQWHGYKRYSIDPLFNGYFYFLNASFYEDFDARPLQTLCRGECALMINTLNDGCGTQACDFGQKEMKTENLDNSNIPDGGFDLPLKKCGDDWDSFVNGWKENKEFIYDLLCAIKNNDQSISFSPLMTGTIIFAKDVYVGAVHYPYVGVRMPNSGSLINLRPDVDIDNDGTTFGFENSVSISYDNDVRLNFFELKDYVGKICSEKVLNSWYIANDWNLRFRAHFAACVKQSNHKDEFKAYVYPDEDNLLIFVNGYRALGSFTDLIKNGTEFNKQEPKDALNKCNAHFNNVDYWENTGNSFVKGINNKNIIYIDGHHPIHTSNHRNLLNFGVSISSCLVTNKFPLRYLLCNACILNTTPNPSGFDERYKSGENIAEEILDQIRLEKIKVKRNASGQITGKIDIVAHSMGYAVAKGVADYLHSSLAPGNKFGVFYVIAPENAIGSATGGSSVFTLNVDRFESVFQYGSDWEKEKRCQQDGVAPQIGINATGSVPKVFIPMTDKYKPIRNFVDAHSITNYGWIFEEPLKIGEGRIIKRNP